MKRIFLTSGLVLCMACPAFATGFGTETGDQAGQCKYSNLGSYDDPVTLTAKWTSTAHTITLVPNPSTTDSNEVTTYLYGSASNSSVNPTALYIAGDGMYTTKTEIAGTNEYSYTGELSEGDTVLTGATPAGKTVTLTFDSNYAAINALNDGNEYASGITGVSPTSTTRVFDGFYAVSDTTGTTPLINSQGEITLAGLGVTNADQNWEAHYTCGEPTHTGTPSLTGYTFNGWAANADGTGTVNWCITENTTVYAKWLQNTHTVTYVCPQPGSESNSGTVPTADSNIAYDDNYTVKANTCAFQGWTFHGWNCSYDIAGGTEHSTGTSGQEWVSTLANQNPGSVWFHTDANVTCYATWTRNTIELTWKDGTNASGGNTLEGAESCAYDDAITLPANPTRPGYDFAGWEVSLTNGL